MNLAPLSGTNDPPASHPAPLRPEPTTRDAKAQLLSWAHQHDGRTSRARASFPAIATGGAVAFLLGLALSWKRPYAKPTAVPISTSGLVVRGITAWAFLARFIPWHHVAAAVTAPRASGKPSDQSRPNSAPVTGPVAGNRTGTSPSPNHTPVANPTTQPVVRAR